MTSTLAMILSTIAMLPLYVVLRWPFFRLPLHVDTCFYVSNHAICGRRVDFSRGWNAHYAGCSKVIPEFFYTLVYLLHGGMRYKEYARLYYSVYSFATGIVVGYAAYVLGGSAAPLYYFGLIAYCMISSEPHYGVYFESAEQFEVLFHVVGGLFILHGLSGPNPAAVAVGVAIWFFNGFFVKLSALIGAAVIALAAVVRFPGSLAPVALGVLAVTALYLVWTRANRQSVFSLVKPLIRHETFYGHGLYLAHYLWRVLQKGELGWEIASSSPVIPGLALLGAVVVGDGIGPVLCYLAAVAAAYFLQVTRVWYYTIPFIPAAALLAAFGLAWLVNQGVNGVVVACILLLTWLALHVIQSYGRLRSGGVASLNRYVWKPHGDAMAEKNLRLEGAAPVLRSRVGKRSLLVFGAWSQCYVLLDTSYRTPLVSAAPWLDHMVPGWARHLNERFLSDPPAFILDTDECLDVGVISRNLGLVYRAVGVFDAEFRLFEFESAVPRERIDLDRSAFVSAAHSAGPETPGAQIETFFNRGDAPS